MIKVTDIAYGRLRAPDLDRMETFLSHFGMVRAARTKDALYMRGTDPDHHIHVTERGEPGFVGLAFYAANAADLEAIATTEGASPVEDIDEPGGGRRVRLTEPNGYQIEIVHGIATLEPLPVRTNPINTGSERDRRIGEASRLRKGPSQVKRIGHAVIATPDVLGSIAWMHAHLGLRVSDEMYVGETDNVVFSFNRVDRGKIPVDHHVFGYVRNERRGLNHLSFEVADIDDVAIGHDHMAAVGEYEHMWGLGRHGIGSHVFDYWCDPWGRVHEHWSDTDLIDDTHRNRRVPAGGDVAASIWGPPAPQKFRERASP